MSPPPTSTSSGESISDLVSSYSYSTVSYLLALTEVILVIMKMDGLRHGLVVSGLTNSTALVGSEQPSLADMESLVVSLLVTLAVILGVMVVANLYTIGQTINALLFSQRTHLQRSVAKHDVINSEGFLQAVKKEVNLLKEMVGCLDAFSGQQSRLIVVVDGLDSVEQRKVLSVLDTVHTLFSDPGSPFIILLAIDPSVITKAIEPKLNQERGPPPRLFPELRAVPVPLVVRDREVLIGVRRPGRSEEEQEEEAGGDGESGQQSGQ